MKLHHALGFVAHGLLLVALSSLAPGLCPGGGTRELWALFMSGVNFFIGAGWIVRRAFAALLPWLRYDYNPARFAPVVPFPTPNRIAQMDTFEVALAFDCDREAA